MRSSSEIRIGLLGYGYWGPNLARNFAAAPGSRVSHVCDLSRDCLARAAVAHPSATLTSDAEDLLASPGVDAVAVATPVSSHFDLAMRALTAGKHVLVEKPLADTAERCRRLIDEAHHRQLLLMVDHTFPYTGAVRKIKELVDRGEIGDIYYYDSVRVNLGLFQHDINVVWDLAVHDLSILDYLLAEPPAAVSANGTSHVTGQPENIAYVTLKYPNNLIAHIHVNWLAPVKIRRTLIGGSEKMIVYDDVEPTEKIKIYDKRVSFESSPDVLYEMQVNYRMGDMWAPMVDRTEALALLVRHFLDCIDSGEQPVTSAESGLRTVQVMEAATRSMRQDGVQIRLDGSH